MGEIIQKIALRDVKCHAAHGWYPEEQLIGCLFTVHLEVSFVSKIAEEQLDNTINYEELNSIILESMGTPKKLLETVVEEILQQVRTKFPFVLTAEVTIVKNNPPMPGQVGSSVVSLKYSK